MTTPTRRLRRLSYPLPTRATVRTRITDRQLFGSRPYTIPDILSALQGGGWFNFAATDFADREAAAYARSAQAFFDTLRAA